MREVNPVDPIKGFSHVNFKHNIIASDVSSKIMSKFLSQKNTIGIDSPFNKSTLVGRNKLGQDGGKTRS